VADEEWVWRTAGMSLTVEVRSTRRETSPNATLSTTNPKMAGINSGNRDEKLASKHLSHGMARRQREN